MARSKAPRKRKPGKSGKPSVARITPPSYPKRFMGSVWISKIIVR